MKIIFEPEKNSLLELNEKSKLIKLWKQHGNKIVDFIQKKCEVKFKKDYYDCILNEDFKLGGISNPLTIRVVGKGLIEFITLIHELIHILMVENKEYFKEKFKEFDEEPKVISHASIFYLLDEIENKFFPNIDFSKRKNIDKENYLKSFELKERIEKLF